MVDTGAYGSGIHGYLFRGGHVDYSLWPSIGEAHQFVLPTGEVKSTTAPRRMPNSWGFVVAPVFLRLAPGIDGILTKEGMRALALRYGAFIDWHENTIRFPTTHTSSELPRVTAIPAQPQAPPPLRNAKETAMVDAARQSILTKYADRFCDELATLPPTRDSDSTMPPRIPGIQPNHRAMFRKIPVPPEELKFLQQYMKPLIEKGFVEPTTSDFNSPLFTVAKKADHPDLLKRYRLVFDFRAVNEMFERWSTRAVAIAGMVHKASRASFASVLDLTAGFHQVLVPPEERDYLAFTLPGGAQYRWAVWPFGFSASPAVMEKTVDALVNGDNEVEFYVDDGLVYTGSTARPRSFRTELQAHVAALERLLTRARERGHFFSRSKAQIMTETVDLLGHQVKVGVSRSAHPEKLAEICALQPPSSRPELQSFLGAVGWVSSVIPSFTSVSAPLWRLVSRCMEADKTHRRGGSRPSKAFFPLRGPELASFRELQQLLQDPLHLRPFDPDLPSVVVTDASQVGFGACLYQQGTLVAMWSQATTETQTRWTVFDLEAFAIVKALTHWKHWLQGRPTTVVTDHKSLLTLAHLDGPMPDKVKRWVGDLVGFQVSLVHVNGSEAQMALSDLLSRNPVPLHPDSTPSRMAVLAHALTTVSTPPTRIQPRVNAVTGLGQAAETEWNRATRKRVKSALVNTLPHRSRASMWRHEGLTEWEARELWLQQLEAERVPVLPSPGTAARPQTAVVAAVAMATQTTESVDEFAFLTSNPDFTEMDGRWYYTDGPLLKPVLREEGDQYLAFLDAHAGRMAGHRAALPTEMKVRSAVWFPDITKKVAAWCASCPTCKEAKSRTTGLPSPLHQVDAPSFPFEVVHVDAVEGLPNTDGLTDAWVVTDRLTHFSFLVPGARTDSASSVARRLFNQVFALVGLPRLLVSDADVVFTSTFAQTLADMADMRHFTTTPHRKQGNGFVERRIRTVRDILRSLDVADRMAWLDSVAQTQFALNDAFSPSLGASPAQLLFGFNPRSPALVGTEYPRGGDEAFAFLKDRELWRSRAREAFSLSLQNGLAIANEHRNDAELLGEEDMVMVSNAVLSDPAEDMLPEKMKRPFHGPFPVDEVTEHNVTVRLPPGWHTATVTTHRDQVRKFHPMAPPPTENQHDEAVEPHRWTVEAVSGHRVQKGHLVYKVAWSDRSVTWETRAVLDADSAIRAYWQRWAHRHQKATVQGSHPRVLEALAEFAPAVEKEPADEPEPEEPDPLSPPSPVTSRSEGEAQAQPDGFVDFPIQAIHQHRVVRGVLSYLVEWEGPHPRTYVTAEDVEALEVTREYWRTWLARVQPTTVRAAKPAVLRALALFPDLVRRLPEADCPPTSDAEEPPLRSPSTASA